MNVKLAGAIVDAEMSFFNSLDGDGNMIGGGRAAPTSGCQFVDATGLLMAMPVKQSLPV